MTIFSGESEDFALPLPHFFKGTFSGLYRLVFVAVQFFGICTVGSLRAQSEQVEFEYVRDAETELTLTKKGEDAWSIDLRHFGGPREGQDVYFQSDANPVPGGHLAENETDSEGEKTKVKIGGIGKPSITLETSNLSDLGNARIDLSGNYRQITVAERLQRARSRFERADAVLNETYQKLRMELGKEKAVELRDRQRDWLQHRDSMAEWEAKGAEDSKTVPAYWDAMLGLTTSRTQFLQLYSGRGIPKGITGKYQDAYGGHLTLKEVKGGVEFSLEVVRGPSLHNGGISGRARLKGNRAYFKEDPADLELKDQKPAELIFTFIDGHIVKIEGKNTDAHHGARAYFDGEYFKEKPVKP